MIRFACRCSNEIEVEFEMAGQMLQCPRCGLLVDVPSLDDLPNLRDDGTYIFREETAAENPAINSPRRIVPPTIYDRSDKQDLRPNLDEYLKSGTIGDTFTRDVELHGKPLRPKYDPITGELVKPMDVKSEPQKPKSKIRGINTRKPVLGYAREKTDVHNPIPSLTEIFVLALRPENLLAWGFVVIVFAFNLALVNLPGVNLFFISLVFPITTLLIIGHLGNVVDEMAMEERDELPVLFRNVSFVDDIWKPGVRVIFSMLVCVLPAMAVRFGPMGDNPAVLVASTVLTYLLFPVVLLTFSCGGVLNNALPWRMFGTIPVIGWKYLFICLTFAIGYEFFITGAMLSFIACKSFGLYLFSSPGIAPPPLQAFPFLPRWVERAMALPTLTLGIYLLHVFGWQLGVVYRRHHDAFPWVLQRHEYSQRRDTTALLQQRAKQLAEENALKRVEALKQPGGSDAAGDSIPVAQPVDRPSNRPAK